MKRMVLIILLISGLGIALACNGAAVPTTTQENTTILSELPATESTTAESASVIPTPTEPATETYIAYVQNDTLFVTHVIGGQAIETKPYATSQMRGGLYNVGWSPSGEFLTFTMFVNSFGHLFVVNVADGSEPIDLGIANDWAWSPDSKLLAFEHEYELWVYSPQNGQSRGLTTHLGTDWLWFSPAFTPNGDALIAAGLRSDHMDKDGNNLYKLYQVPLDGSARSSYPPEGLTALTEEISSTRPASLNFSPDGQQLAIASTVYVDGCKADAKYFMANADGSDLHELTIPSINALRNPAEKIFFLGDSLVWDPQSDSVWVNGWVRDCSQINKMIAEPKLYHLTLDGQELEVITGTYGNLSLDRSGTLLGVVDKSRPQHRVQILGLDGHLVIDLGDGDYAALQP